MSEKLPESSQKVDPSHLQNVILFTSGAVYGFLGTSEPTVPALGSGVVLSGTVEYAARPQKKGIGVAVGGGIIAGIMLREFLRS